MKRFLFILALLALVSTAWSAVADLKVGNGTPENTMAAGDGYFTGDLEVDGVFLEDAVTAGADDTTPTVAGGNVLVTGVNTVPTAITTLDDEIPGATYTIICGDVANPSTIADAGQFNLTNDWVPATIGDALKVYCRAANTFDEVSRSYKAADGGPVIGDPFLAGADAVGAPGHSWIADPNSGIRNSAPNVMSFVTDGADRGTCDVNGLNAALGGTTPNPAVVTTLTANGDTAFNENVTFGQGQDDLIVAYKERSNYITYSDTFDVGNDADLAVRWDLTQVVGLGTNEETTVDGWNTLTTGGAGGPDSECTRTNGLNHYRAYAPRIECSVDLGAVAAGQNFRFGFYAAANEFVEIIHEPATSANWLLRVDDTAGAETIDSGVPATLNATKLEIAVTNAGVITWAIDDVAMTVVGLTNNMTANAHYVRWILTDVAAAAHTASIDYFLSEQLKQQ